MSLYLCLYTQYLLPTRLLKVKFTEKWKTRCASINGHTTSLIFLYWVFWHALLLMKYIRSFISLPFLAPPLRSPCFQQFCRPSSNEWSADFPVACRLVQWRQVEDMRNLNKKKFLFCYPHTLTIGLEAPVYRGFSGEGKDEGKSNEEWRMKNCRLRRLRNKIRWPKGKPM